MGPGRDSNPNKGRTEYPKSGVSSFFHLKSGLFWPTLKAPTGVWGGHGTEQATDRLDFSRTGGALWSCAARGVQVPRRERPPDLHQCQTRHGWQELHFGEQGSVCRTGAASCAGLAIPSRVGHRFRAQREPPQNPGVGASERAAIAFRCPREACRTGRNSRRRRAQLCSGPGAAEAISGSRKPALEKHRAASRRARSAQVKANRTALTNQAAWFGQWAGASLVRHCTSVWCCCYLCPRNWSSV